MRRRTFLSLALAATTLCALPGLPTAAADGSMDRSITQSSVGAARLGMTVAAERRALKGFTLKRTTDGEGVALIEVLRGSKRVMTLYAGETDAAAPVNEKAVVEVIEVTDPGYRTKAGVHPGLLLREVIRRYGKLKQIVKSEIESREFATFAAEPKGMTFQVGSDQGEAGKYASGKSMTSKYSSDARLYSISVRKPK